MELTDKKVLEYMPWAERYPWMLRYICMFGLGDLIPTPEVTDDIDTAQKIYKKCVEKELAWRELLNYNPKEEEGIIT